MLCLPRKKSNRIPVCEALLRRAVLNREEESRIREQLWRMVRGLDGEQRADRFWEELNFESEYMLLHNYETIGRIGYTHQMDTLFICPRFVLVLELKHIAGEIMYDAARHQLLRSYNGEVQALGDPFSQVSRHEEWVEHFLWEIGVRGLPVVSAVVVTTTSSVLKAMPEQFHVFKLEGLRFKLQQWYERYPVVVNTGVMGHIRDELLRRHTPLKWMPPIENLQLRRGVLCECGLRMDYAGYGLFICKCGERIRDGFVRGLEDYRLLVDEWITNKEFRDFFEIENVHAVSKILKRLGLEYSGDTKARRYRIPEDILDYRPYTRGVKET